MNTGHDGSMTTVHANAPRDAFSRLETMVMMASQNVPDKVIRQQLASAIHLVVQCARLSDGSRRITGVAEVTGVRTIRWRCRIFSNSSGWASVREARSSGGSAAVARSRNASKSCAAAGFIFRNRFSTKRSKWRISDRRQICSARLLSCFLRARFSGCVLVWIGAAAGRQAISTPPATVRTNMRAGRDRAATDLVHRERRGSFAFLGDFVDWLGLSIATAGIIQQANLTSRAADIVGICSPSPFWPTCCFRFSSGLRRCGSFLPSFWRARFPWP